MIITEIMTKDELLKLQNLLQESKEDAVLFVEDKIQLRSKKKRIQKKFRKKIIAQLSSMEQAVHTDEEVIAEQPEVDVSGLPVTFLLGLGKEYFADLDIVKYYYTKSQEAYYKNKDLLIETINKSIQEETSSVRKEIITKVEEKKK